MQSVVSNGVVGDWRLADDEFLQHFKPPGPDEKPDTLRLRNPLPREARIEFEEVLHTYTIDGKTKAPRSVTGLVHSYKTKGFDPADVIPMMKRGRRWPEKRLAYLKEDSDVSMSDSEIEERWRKNGKVASSRGTLLHWHAEVHLNGYSVEPPHSPEFEQFLAIEQKLSELGYEPFRTEVCSTCFCPDWTGLVCAHLRL